jgi:hypothetical protein
MIIFDLDAVKKKVIAYPPIDILEFLNTSNLTSMLGLKNFFYYSQIHGGVPCLSNNQYFLLPAVPNVLAIAPNTNSQAQPVS